MKDDFQLGYESGKQSPQHRRIITGASKQYMNGYYKGVSEWMLQFSSQVRYDDSLDKIKEEISIKYDRWLNSNQKPLVEAAEFLYQILNRLENL